jgi:hypothetical protein
MVRLALVDLVVFLRAARRGPCASIHCAFGASELALAPQPFVGTSTGVDLPTPAHWNRDPRKSKPWHRICGKK